MQTGTHHQSTTYTLLLQGQRFFSGHWYYSLWNTALIVTHKGSEGEDGHKEEPIQLAASRVFRASDHDNDCYGRDFGNVQSLNAIHRSACQYRCHVCVCIFLQQLCISLLIWL